MMRFRSATVVATLTVGLVACGGDTADVEAPADETADEAPAGTSPDADDEPAEESADATAEPASLDCNSIEMIVPNAPGGGSDQQVRRLEPHIAEFFGTNVNVVYREGSGGAIAWDSLLDAAPDGCTVSNVVSPNVVIASMEDDQQAFAADDFTYIAWTEVAPTALLVANDAPWATIEEFFEEARENPGSLTIGGSGQHGELISEQIMEAADVDLSYVPMEEGVGNAVPLLLGGHLDTALTSSAHATGNSDTVRALALGGEENVEAIADVPTFHEAGYEGVTVLIAQGVIAPPGTPDEIAQQWNEAVHYAMDQTAGELTERGLNPMETSADEALAYIQEQMAAFGLE